MQRLPVMPIQLRMLERASRSKDSEIASHLVAAFLLRGHLDRLNLERAMNEVAARHDALRTVFIQDGSGAAQLVLPRLPIRETPLPDNLAPTDEPVSLVRAVVGSGFERSAGPLWRYALVQRSRDEQLFIVVVDHIVCDGWSLALLVRDIAACYQGDAPRWSRDHWQFGDFVRWQAERTDDERAAALQFWTQSFARGGRASGFDLPLAGDTASSQFHASEAHLRLSRMAANRLHAFARDVRVSLFVVLAAGLAVLLLPYSLDHVVPLVGARANRELRTVQDTIGCFADSTLLRIDLSGLATFRDVVFRVREAVLETLSHGLPLSIVTQTLGVRGFPVPPGLTQIFFDATPQLIGRLEQGLEIPGVISRPVTVPVESTFDQLSIWAVEHEQELTLDAVFPRVRFQTSTVQQALSEWIEFLQLATTEPNGRFSALAAGYRLF